MASSTLARPKVLILHRRTEPHTGEFEAGEDPCRGAGQPGFHFRRELEHLAVAHPETFVLQSSPVDPQHLALGLRRGLESARPAVFRVFAPQTARATPDHTHPFVRAGAARDGRDFPLYTFGPHATRAWGDRFEAGGNPEPDRDWPTYSLDILDEHGEAATLTEAFTFADFAAQDPVFFGLLRSVPRPFWNDDMVPLADYLALDPEHGAMKVPYLWMVDGDNVLQRVVPAHALVLACQDRLNHWHILQELGGIRNTHAERAAREAEERVRAEAGREIEALQAEHAAELERVRRETAGEAMDKLSRVLLELDLEAAAPSVARAVPAAARARPAGDGAATGTAPAVEEEPEPEEAISEDPWIETFRCTSCNECININPLLFQYNADKLATIANSRAGTYADLVAAAEKCPARCIHPGKPLDTSEPNLEALMKRAEKFN